jgi:hypothetical protein
MVVVAPRAETKRRESTDGIMDLVFVGLGRRLALADETGAKLSVRLMLLRLTHRLVAVPSVPL